MSVTSVSQQVQNNVQAQLDAWDAQIQRYAAQAKDFLDEYTKQAFLDELVHLRAKRDQFAEMFMVTDSSATDSVANEDTEDEDDWNDDEPSDEDLEKIKDGSVDDEYEEDDDDKDDAESEEETSTMKDNQPKAPDYVLTELIYTYSTSSTFFPKFLIR